MTPEAKRIAELEEALRQVRNALGVAGRGHFRSTIREISRVLRGGK